MHACKPFAWQLIEERANQANVGLKQARVVQTLTNHKRPVLCVAFSNSHLITCSADGSAQVYARSDFSLVLTFKGHASDILSCQLLEDVEGITVLNSKSLVLTASRDCSVKVWNYITGETMRTFSHARPVRSAVCSKDVVVSHSGKSTLSFWSLKDEVLLFQENNPFPMASALAVQLPVIAFGTFGKTWCLCEIVQIDVEEVIVKKVSGHERAVLAVALDKNGERALTGGEDRQAILYDLITGTTILHRMLGHAGPILEVRFSSSRPDLGITMSTDKTARIWNLLNGSCTLVLNGTDAVRCGVLKGGYVLLGCTDNTAAVYDVSEGGYLRILLLCKGAQLKRSSLQVLPLEVLKKIKSFLI